MIHFSVVIPLYNKQDTIGRTLCSVLSQKYGSFEVIVVDDGSTDKSIDLVRTFCSDNRIKIVQTENRGVSCARNKGIQEAKYDWIYLLDADDELLPNAFEVFIKMVDKYPQAECYSALSAWGVDKKISSSVCFTRNTLFMIWKQIIDPAPRNVLIKKSVILKYGLFDERMSFYEDWDFSLRMAQCGSIAYTNTYVARYNQTSNGLSSKPHPMQRDMAYYIPEKMQQHLSFWYKALLYENLQMTKLYWSGHKAETEYYENVEAEYFDWRFRALHWIRQKLIRRGFI